MLKRCLYPVVRIVPTLVLICFVFSVEANAGNPVAAVPWETNFFGSGGKELLADANAVTTPEKGDVLVLLDEATYSFDAEGRCSSRYRLVYRILSQAGIEDWASIEAGWAPWYQERPRLRARVVTPDGAEHLLLPQSIADSPLEDTSTDVFSDGRVVRAPLPALAVGAVVEQEIITDEKAPSFAKGSVNRFYFGRTAPTLKTRLTIESPSVLPLRYAVRLLPEVAGLSTVQNGRERIVFESGPIEALKSVENGMPGDIVRWPSVAFTAGKSWAEVAAGYGELVDRQIANSDVSTLVRDIIGANSERDIIAAKLLALLRKEIRYTGIEFGSASIVPHTPDSTLTQKYGDCKDQAALLVKMLRTAGVPAYLALLRSGLGEDVDPDLPGLGNFNHAIVYVPGTPSLWIDPTDKFRPLGELPLSDQGKRALITGEKFSALTVTPEAPSHENRQEETREFLLSELGASTVNETMQVWGSIAAAYRSEYGRKDGKNIRKQLDDYASKSYLAEPIGKLDISDPKDVSGPFRIRMEMKAAKRGYTDDNEAAVAILPIALIERLPSELTGDEEKTEPAPRKRDYLLAEPYLFDMNYRIVPPPGYRLVSMPDSGTVHLGPMALSKEFREEPDGTVTAKLRFDTGKRHLSPAEFEETRSALKLLQSEKPLFVKFEQLGQLLLATGKVPEALAEFRRLSALHPTEALHHTQLAHALLGLGLAAAARKEAELAVAIEPDSFLAHRTLAFTLQHDLIGRLRGKGYERNRALAEYRKAKALDPTDVVTRADLAILQEFDEQGERYGLKADLARAIEEYQALRADLKSHDFDINLGICLFRTERWKELKALALSLEPPESRNEFLLVAIAAGDGASAAIKEAKSRIADAASRQKALEITANSLIRVRNYQGAAELLDEVAKGGANAVSLHSRSEVLRKVQRFDKAILSDAAPTTVIKKMLLSLMVPESVPYSFLSLFVRDIIDAAAKESNGGDDVQKGLKALKAKTFGASGDLPPDVAADIALSSMEFKVEGNDSIGYRIETSSSAQTEQKSLVLFVTREAGDYRIVACNLSPEIIGMEVLRRVAAGDLNGAKVWLDRVRGEASAVKNEDAAADNPLVLIWSKDSVADADLMRLAGASLLSEMHSEEIVPLLLHGEGTKGDIGRAVAISLLRTYLAEKKYPEVLEQCTKMEKEYPLSATLFACRAAALGELNRLGELKNEAEERLKKLPKDRDAVGVLAHVDRIQGNFDEAIKSYKILVEAGTANAWDYNNLAWLGLFQGPDYSEFLSFAQRAVSLTGGKKAGTLNTQAALFAETGKTAEARETILKAIAANDEMLPNSADWYVLGRIAELYGENEAATEAYQRVVKPAAGADLADSPYTLAQKRLVKSGKQSAQQKP